MITSATNAQANSVATQNVPASASLAISPPDQQDGWPPNAVPGDLITLSPEAQQMLANANGQVVPSGGQAGSSSSANGIRAATTQSYRPMAQRAVAVIQAYEMGLASLNDFNQALAALGISAAPVAPTTNDKYPVEPGQKAQQEPQKQTSPTGKPTGTADPLSRSNSVPAPGEPSDLASPTAGGQPEQAGAQPNSLNSDQANAVVTAPQPQSQSQPQAEVVGASLPAHQPQTQQGQTGA